MLTMPLARLSSFNFHIHTKSSSATCSNEMAPKAKPAVSSTPATCNGPSDTLNKRELDLLCHIAAKNPASLTLPSGELKAIAGALGYTNPGSLRNALAAMRNKLKSHAFHDNGNDSAAEGVSGKAKPEAKANTGKEKKGKTAKNCGGKRAKRGRAETTDAEGDEDMEHSPKKVKSERNEEDRDEKEDGMKAEPGDSGAEDGDDGEIEA